MRLTRGGCGWTLFVALLATSPGVPRAQPETKPFIAVLDLEVAGGTREQGLALSNQLRAEILKSGQYTVVDRSQVDAILDEQAFQQSGLCTSQECAVQVGRILGIQRIVTGTVTRVDDELWQVSALFIDVETAETLRAETLNHEGPYRDLLFTGMRRLADLLARTAPAPRVADPSPGELATWRLKWIGALTLGLAAGYYGYAEAQAAADSNDEQKSILTRMDAASANSDAAQYNTLADQLESEQDASEDHKRTSDLSFAGAVLFLGLAAWVYFDPPEPAGNTTAWMPLLLPEREGLRVAVIARW